MTDKAKENGMGPGSVEIGGVRLGTETFEMSGERFTIRELTPDEIDEADEAARQPDKTINGRLSTRLSLAKALVEPKKTADEIGKLGNRTFLMLVRKFNDLNNLPPENPTPPAG